MATITFADYLPKGATESIIEGFINKTCGIYSYDSFINKEYKHIHIMCLQIRASEADSVIRQIDNLLNKVSVFYGQEEKDSFIKERDCAMSPIFEKIAQKFA